MCREMNVFQTAEIIAQRLASQMGAESVWLFGSHARNQAGPDSDLDLLAIVPFSHESRYRRAVTAQKLLADVKAPKDIIVMTAEEWEQDLRVPSSLSSTVLREGVSLLHER
jgi:uncharacterized protein